MTEPTDNTNPKRIRRLRNDLVDAINKNRRQNGATAEDVIFACGQVAGELVADRHELMKIGIIADKVLKIAKLPTSTKPS